MSRLASIAAALLLALPAASLARSPKYATPPDPAVREMTKCVNRCTDKITSCSKKCKPPKKIDDPAAAQRDPSIGCVQRCQVDAGRCMESCQKK